VFGLTEEAVRGGGTTIHTGHRGFNLRPYTSGHGRLPAMIGGFAPELAVLHVVTQSIDMTTHEARIRVLEALAPAPADRRAGYSRIVRAVVSETVREELEHLMKTVIKDPFIDGLIEEGLARGMQQGKAQGEADAILRVLDARGLKVTAAQHERIVGCTDLEQLQEWITRAATAATVADVFA
jgi:predicted transposase YdaD